MAADKFTKADVVGAIFGKTGMNRKDIVRVMDLFVHEVKGALMRRCVVELRGFGTFEVRTRKARPRARNPKTGEAVTVRPHGAVVFRPGRDLKRDVKAVTEEEPAQADTPDAFSGGPAASAV